MQEKQGDIKDKFLLSSNSEIRVTVQQPSLAQYRIPVFRELAKRPGITLRVAYGDKSKVPNVPPDGFQADFNHLCQQPIPGGYLHWHQPQIRDATKTRSDVLVLTWNIQYMSLLPGLLRARKNHVGTVLWGHGYSKREAGWRAKARSAIARMADTLLFYNQATADHYVLGRHFDPERVFVALNCLDQQPIQNARAEWLGDRRRLIEFQHENDLDSGNLILFVSRLDPANRVDLLITATSLLVAEIRDIQLVIIGSGDEERHRLETLADTLGIRQRTRFLGPIYDESRVAPWFLSASVFCYPQNIGLSLLHAFGYGLPVITSDRIENQNPEIEALIDGHNGLLYRHGDVQSLAKRLKALLQDDALRRQMAANALEAAHNKFTLAKMVDGMEAAIRCAYCRQNRS